MISLKEKKGAIFDLGSTLIEYENIPWSELFKLSLMRAYDFLPKAGIEQPEFNKFYSAFLEHVIEVEVHVENIGRTRTASASCYGDQTPYLVGQSQFGKSEGIGAVHQCLCVAGHGPEVDRRCPNDPFCLQHLVVNLLPIVFDHALPRLGAA